MWPIIFNLIRTNAVYITAPIAAVVGVIGYNIENLISDKHTPSSSMSVISLSLSVITLMIKRYLSTINAGSIQETRAERLSDEASLKDPTRVEKLKLNENVLGRNLSPSLQQKN